MKRRINLSLHWKSYFINLIWKCKAVWNAAFSLTVLLNMHEAQISSCATLFIQSFSFWSWFLWGVFPPPQLSLLMASGSGGVAWWQRPRGCLPVVGRTWPLSPMGHPVERGESTRPAFSPLSASCTQMLFVLGTHGVELERGWEQEGPQGSVSEPSRQSCF